MPAATHPPKVAVLALGGTIAMASATGTGVTPQLDAGQLVAAVPGLADTGIIVHAETFRSRPGAPLTFDDLVALAARCRDLFAAGIDGVVVTQGTDTIEETAYLLDLLHTGPQPLVVTGAMRNPSLAGADGPANLLAAIRVAAHPRARELGCLVVLADEIHAAARVRKTHATSVSTFASANGGPLGYLVEGTPRVLARPATRHTLPAPAAGSGSLRVGLYTATLGDDGALLTDLGARLDGLVVAGFGVGHVPAGWLDALTDLAARIPVVLTSRTGAGPVLTQTYGFPGSEQDLIARGLIPAGWLDPYKARILLHLALASGADPTTAATTVHVAGGLHTEPWPWATTGSR